MISSASGSRRCSRLCSGLQTIGEEVDKTKYDLEQAPGVQLWGRGEGQEAGSPFLGYHLPG